MVHGMNNREKKLFEEVMGLCKEIDKFGWNETRITECRRLLKELE